MDRDIKEMKEKLIPEVEKGNYVESLDKIERRVKDLEIQVKTFKYKKLMRDKEDYDLGRQRNWKKQKFNHRRETNRKPSHNSQFQIYRSGNYINRNYNQRNPSQSYQHPQRPNSKYWDESSSHISHKSIESFPPSRPYKSPKPKTTFRKADSPSKSSHQVQRYQTEAPSSPSFLGTFLGRKRTRTPSREKEETTKIQRSPVQQNKRTIREQEIRWRESPSPK
ncbi:Hypothetical predicted protein [Pelobates cultripes]|uniref:Uncharacterized protein n=1 Tax=Pelobates cultripes TaxID=61616 RepID=A0AAD1S488_PELCU|nr:Hypothetical predicted protein [Pelobates cultripes]